MEALTDSELLQTFSGWLRGMGDDVLGLARVLEAEQAPGSARQVCAESLGYLLRSLELIPEGLEDLGYLDAAFAVRVLCQGALQRDSDLGAAEGGERLARLAAEADVVAEFLGDGFEPLREIVFSPRATSLHGLGADELLADSELRLAALSEVRSWVENYGAPKLGDGQEELVKIRSFFRTRLRREA